MSPGWLYLEKYLDSDIGTCCKWKMTSKLTYLDIFYNVWPSGQILTSSKKLFFQIQNQRQKLCWFMVVIKKLIFWRFPGQKDPPMTQIAGRAAVTKILFFVLSHHFHDWVTGYAAHSIRTCPRFNGWSVHCLQHALLNARLTGWPVPQFCTS